MPTQEWLSPTERGRSCARVVLIADRDLVLRHHPAASDARCDLPIRREAPIVIEPCVSSPLAPPLRSFIDHVVVPALLDRVLRERSASVADGSPRVRPTA